MLVEFTPENFRSFKERMTLSLVRANLASRDKHVDANNVFESPGGVELLTSAAVFGPNAGGKTNLVAAFRFMRSFVLNSSKETQAGEAIPVEQFVLDSESPNMPSRFEVVFFHDDRQYRYGFEVDQSRVISEWLFHVPLERESRLFERDGDQFNISNVFKEGRELASKTRSNALFISVVSQFNGEIANRVLSWFREAIVFQAGDSGPSMHETVSALEDEARRNAVANLVRALDVGIEDISVEQTDLSSESLKKRVLANRGGPFPFVLRGSPSSGVRLFEIRSAHRLYESDGTPGPVVYFDLDKESHGTQKLIGLAGPLLDKLKKGGVLLIDELDSRLHPLITCALIDLFNSHARNPKHAQLIFTTHDTSLLSKDRFRRDQLWFVEKSAQGKSWLRSLAEYRVRNDSSFEKDYLNGKYRGIPYLGDLDCVIGDLHE